MNYPDLRALIDASAPEVAALRQLDLIRADDVVRWASEQVAVSDLAGMVELAAMSLPADSAAVAESLGSLLSQAGAGMLTDADARRIAATRVARGILDGSITPIGGARLVWWRIADRRDTDSTPFDGFIGAASEWEDDPDHRAEHERGIVAAAREFLATHSTR